MLRQKVKERIQNLQKAQEIKLPKFSNPMPFELTADQEERIAALRLKRPKLFPSQSSEN